MMGSASSNTGCSRVYPGVLRLAMLLVVVCSPACCASRAPIAIDMVPNRLLMATPARIERVSVDNWRGGEIKQLLAQQNRTPPAPQHGATETALDAIRSAVSADVVGLR